MVHVLLAHRWVQLGADNSEPDFPQQELGLPAGCRLQWDLLIPHYTDAIPTLSDEVHRQVSYNCGLTKKIRADNNTLLPVMLVAWPMGEREIR